MKLFRTFLCVLFFIFISTQVTYVHAKECSLSGEWTFSNGQFPPFILEQHGSECPFGIPTKLSNEQAIRDTIRRYNGGVEYRWEPRDNPDCEGSWVLYDSAVSGGDRQFVDNVLNCKL